MITETIFIILFVAMIVFLFLTLRYQNQAFGAFTIILAILIGSQLLPGVGGVQYQTGATINETGGNTVVTNDYSTFSNIPLATVFFVLVLYLSMQIISFRKTAKQEAEEAI